MDEDLAYWLAWQRLPQMGAVRLRRLHAVFGSMQAAWHQEVGAIAAALQLSPTVLEPCLRARALWPPAAQLAGLAAAGIAAVSLADPRYPERLRHVHDAPPLLYYCGRWTAMARAVAIVGTRRPTAYGREMAFVLARDLTAAGVVVVSGMAAGIDAAAHHGALSRGETVAVLGSSPEIVYPPGHRALYGRIVESGMTVAEYPPGTKPEPGRFPARNRLISGLCAGVVVVEAGERSGALITADFAAEQGREVFALPGPAHSPASAGPHQLLREGATLVTSAGDVLRELGWSEQASAASDEAVPADLTKEERDVYIQLNEQPQHFDVLRRHSGSSAGALAAILLSLELKGRVRQLPGHIFVKGS